MGSITDYLVIFVILFSFWRGLQKDLLDLFLGPISLILAVIGGWWYYQISGDSVISLGVAIAGPILLRIIIWIFRKLFIHESSEKKKQSGLSLASLICASLNTIWGTALFVAALVFVMIIPSHNPRIGLIQKDIKASLTFTLAQDLSAKRLPEEPISLEKIKKWTKPISGFNEDLQK